ncbi:hypothetical protein SBA1_780011 [Candidatus Sulfotelmatobacter kueseliae]|uniref:Uncharacterized protein n=1 Tax=Candidatus Sulfotelmatobacter kueseliae TaxID=2042962 RepID=A0A2U3L7D8_9BACT|nr:hypothetical protein SBA1_780011 [Candidatus Sulfotelmatobacter kueseliae]
MEKNGNNHVVLQEILSQPQIWEKTFDVLKDTGDIPPRQRNQGWYERADYSRWVRFFLLLVLSRDPSLGKPA